MLDLRKEMDGILNSYGHYVLLQRMTKKLHCRCWHEKEQTAEAGCPFCLGSGYVSRIERHLIRRDIASPSSSLPNLIEQAPAAQVADENKLFFMRFDAQPKEGDLIFEVGWKGNKPTHLINAYEINYPDELRGDNGRIEFYQVWAKNIVFDTPIKGISIRKLGPVKNFELIR